MLDEIELLVAGGGLEVVAVDSERFPAFFALFVDDAMLD